MYRIDKILQGLESLAGVENTRARAAILKKMTSYMKGILAWNDKVNLTAVNDRDSFIVKHFADSLACAPSHVVTGAERIVDIGSGGGFPGVPLALVYPEKDFVLIDSLNKRLQIIEDLCAKIGIENVTCVHGRAEDLAKKGNEYREAFDVAVSRSVASMATLAEYCLPFVKVSGTFIAYKSSGVEQELCEAEKAIQLLGGGTVRKEQPDGIGQKHILIYISKEKHTPDKFPRKAGTPSKRPL